MREERMKILKMLDEGKITVEEANELLETLGFTERIGEYANRDWDREDEGEQGKDKKGFDLKEETREFLEDLKKRGKKLKESFDADYKEELMANVEEIKQSIEEGLEEGLRGLKEGLSEGKKALSSHKGLFQKFFENIGFLGEGIRTEWKLNGLFAGEGIKEVSLSTINGRIQLEPAKEDQYTVLIKGDVRGVENEPEALEKLKQALEVIQEDDRLSVRVQGGRRVSASIYICLPADEIYDLELHSTNGRIEIEDIKGNDLEAETVNGRIVLDGVRAQKANLETVNGRLEVTDVDIVELNTKTMNGSTYVNGVFQQQVITSTNGSINVEPEVKDELTVKINNSNGRIKLLLPEEEYDFNIDAKSSMGSLSVDLPDIKIIKDIGKIDHKHIVASNDSETGKKVSILTRNSMGSTYIGLR